MLGDGLLTSEGEAWLWQRRMAQPAFHRRRVEAFGPLITDYTVAMLDEWEQSYAAAEQPVELVDAMSQLTLKIVARALFGYKITSAADKFGRAVEVLNECMGHFDPANPAIYARFPVAVRTVRFIVEQIIQERRQQGGEHHDFLALLLEAYEEIDASVRNQQVRDQIITLLLAGHETTAKALSWTLYLLSQHPAAEAQARQEVTTALNGRLPTTDDLPALPYTWMVIQEAMRLYPPIWLVSRIAVQDDVIGGYHIPAGSLVAVSQFVMHHRPGFWERPDKFYPEHFLPEQVAARPAFAYFPFSGGPRLCLGKYFATMEAHLVLATILQRFTLQLLPGHPVTPEALVTLRPRHGLPMIPHLSSS
jgi:cytochrome P450